jgi:hypothetical protein
MKESYETPELIKYGTVEEITLSGQDDFDDAQGTASIPI